MKLFFHFLKDRLFLIITFVLINLSFFVGFLLFNVSILIYLYCSIIGVLLFTLYIVIDFLLFYKKHKQLYCLNSLPDNIVDIISTFNNTLDKDYLEIIKILYDEQLTTKELASKKEIETFDYFATWVHQIKTPIASMRLKLSSQDNDFSRNLANDLFSIEQYVEMTLTYLRLDNSVSDYVFKECSLSEIINNSVKKFAIVFISKGIKVDIKSFEKKVLTDEKWLSFVIEQVLSNALKYTFNGSITISFEDDDTLSITDTGIGILSEDIPRIFEKGFSGKNGRLNTKSSGLGLYLCKRICDNLNCDVIVQSKINVGTTIKIIFDKKTVNE